MKVRRLRSKTQDGCAVFGYLCRKHFCLLFDIRVDLHGKLYDQDKGSYCDYPKCSTNATAEYFPNLLSIARAKTKLWMWREINLKKGRKKRIERIVIFIKFIK